MEGIVILNVSIVHAQQNRKAPEFEAGCKIHSI